MNPLRWRVPRRSPAEGGRIPELDGLRAVAVLPVIALHFGADINGGAGVTVFFALSGYIITTLLLAEHHRAGTVDLRTFYLRRFRRLLPAATMVVIATVLVGRAMRKPAINHEAFASLTYWANFERFSSHYSYGHTAYAPLEHFWSLAIEEQFYVVLPVLCLVLLPLGRRAFASIVAVAAIASAVFAFVHRNSPQYYFHSFGRVCELLAGVVLAVVLPAIVQRVGARRAAIAGYLALVALVAVFLEAFTPQPIFVALIACVVIAGRPRLLAVGPLVVIGTYSYGLYLWHPLAIVLSDHLVVRILLTVVMTFLSFHLIEFPIRRSLPIRRAVTAMAVLSVIAVAVVALPQPAAKLRFVQAAPVIAAAPSDSVARGTISTLPQRHPSTTDVSPSTAGPPLPKVSVSPSTAGPPLPKVTVTPTTADPTTVDATTVGPTTPAAGDVSTSVPVTGTSTPPTDSTSLPETTAPPDTTAPTETTAPAVRPLRISGAGDSTQMFTDTAWQAFAAAYPDMLTWVQPPDDIVPWTSGADGWIGTEAASLGLALSSDGPQGGLDRQGCPMIYDLPIRATDTYDFTDSSALHSATPISSCDWHQWIPAALAEMHLDVLVVSWSVTDMWQYKMADGHHGVVGDPEFDALLDQRRADFEAMAAQYGTKVVWTTYQPLSTDAAPLRWARPETADKLAAMLLQRPCVSDLRTVVRSDPTFDWYQDGYHFTPEGAARAVSTIVPEVLTCAGRTPPT